MNSIKQRIAAVALLAAGMILILAMAGGNIRNFLDKEPESDLTQIPAETPPKENASQTEPTENASATKNTDKAGAVNPLTGLPIAEGAEKRRPAAVMLNNLKAAQPQLGISQADIIYEAPIEGGITRMLALYQSVEEVGDLGSIRSVRPYYLEIALGHDAILVHAGGSNEAYRDITSWDVDHMDGVRGKSDARIFWRDQARRRSMGYEHSMLTSGEKIQDYLDEGHFRTDHRASYLYSQSFAEDGAPADGTAAERVEVKFSSYKTGLFEYDARAKKYMVSQYGAAYTDGNTGGQVGVTNLLVLETSISTLDKEGRLQVITSSVGKGTFFCGGKSIPIRWQKADRNSPFLYTLENGFPLTFGMGNSYICIIDPDSGEVTVS